MDVTEWQKRLEDTFTINGVIGGNLLEVLDRERTCGKYFTNTFHGSRHSSGRCAVGRA